jgi:hypothetical protein
MSESQIVAVSSFDLSVPAIFEEMIDALENALRLLAGARRAVAVDLAGQINSVVVNDTLAHPGSYFVTIDAQ